MDYRNRVAPCNPAHMCENLLKSYDKVLRSYKKAVAQFAYNLATEICKNGQGFDEGPRTKPGCNMPSCPFARAARLAEEETFQKRPSCYHRPPDKPQHSSTNCGSPGCPFNLAPAPPPTPVHRSYEDLSPKSPCQNPHCPFGQKEPVGPCGSTKCPFAVSFEPMESHNSCGKSPDQKLSDNHKMKNCSDPRCPFSSANTNSRQTCGDPNCPFETAKKKPEVSDEVSSTSKSNPVKEPKRPRNSSSKQPKPKSESKRSSSKTKRRVSSKEQEGSNKREKKDTQPAAKRKSSSKAKKPKSSKVSQRSSNSTEPSPKKKRSFNSSTMTDTVPNSPKENPKKVCPPPPKNSTGTECVMPPPPMCSYTPRCPNPRCPMNPPCAALYECLQSQTTCPSFQPQSRMLLTSVCTAPANSASNLCYNPGCPVNYRQGVTKQLYVEIGNPCSSTSCNS